MIIECPSCRFRRDVPDASIRPGKKYKVTCPRCSSVFHFSLPEEEEQEATRPVRGSDRWKEQPARHTRSASAQDEEDEDDRDPVAENIVRWVPPLTALICAGIALYGFVYYQFFL